MKSFIKQLFVKPQFQIAYLIVCGLLALGALIFPVALRPAIYQLKAGDVSQQDIQAPRTIDYESSVLTEIARNDAKNKIASVYLQADPSIARKSLEKFRLVLTFINTIRSDEYASVEQKRADLLNIQDITISSNLADQILNQTNSRWDTIQQEALRVLEQIMRNTIREDRVEDTRKQIPTLISFALSEDLAAIVTDLITPFVIPNSLYSEENTDLARQAAADAVQPINKSYVAGEIIVRRGQIINETTWEALQQFGLIKPLNQTRDIIAAVTLTISLIIFILLYSSRRNVQSLVSPRNLVLISVLFFLFLYSGKFIIPNRTVIPYIFPTAAFALTVASLYNLEIGLILSLILSVLISFGMPNGLDLTIYYIFTSMSGLLALGKGRRISSFFWSGFVISLTGSTIILAYRLPEAITDWIGILTLGGAAFVNGLLSATITLIFHFFFSQFFGVTTAIQLLELSRPDHPLLQFMLQNAPGSYQHSLQVANLAEQAAETIGADTLLVRVGAIYHDAGKAENPNFFVENQVPGKVDSHDDIPPEISAATIIKHVSDGVQLGKKYRLPPRIMDFMREHHGTLLTKYQYTRAVQACGAENVNLEDFQYPGPPPQSKETALLMLADGCEARARAEIPKNEEELRAIITKIFEYIQKEGQLNNTSLTLRDIHKIKESFTNTLKNTYHQRIQYPELKPAQSRQTDVTPEEYRG